MQLVAHCTPLSVCGRKRRTLPHMPGASTKIFCLRGSPDQLLNHFSGEFSGTPELWVIYLFLWYSLQIDFFLLNSKYRGAWGCHALDAWHLTGEFGCGRHRLLLTCSDRIRSCVLLEELHILIVSPGPRCSLLPGPGGIFSSPICSRDHGRVVI